MRKETSFKSKIFWIKILLGYLLFSNHHGHCFWVDLLDFLLELCVIFSFDFFIHLSLAYDVVAKSPVRMMRVIEKIVVLLSSIHHRFAVSMLCIFHRSIMRRIWQAAFSRGYETSTIRCYSKDFNTIDWVISHIFLIILYASLKLNAQQCVIFCFNWCNNESTNADLNEWIQLMQCSQITQMHSI